MKKFIKVMKALSDPNRVKMVKLLHTQYLRTKEVQLTSMVAVMITTGYSGTI